MDHILLILTSEQTGVDAEARNAARCQPLLKERNVRSSPTALIYSLKSLGMPAEKKIHQLKSLTINIGEIILVREMCEGAGSFNSAPFRVLPIIPINTPCVVYHLQVMTKTVVKEMRTNIL